MARIVEIHPSDPQARRIAEVVATIRRGGLVAYPTDSCYAFGCHIGDKRATDRIRRIRQTDRNHNFTLVCSDLSEFSLYARFDNWAYLLIKSLTPGPYTFILQASAEVPKRFVITCLGYLSRRAHRRGKRFRRLEQYVSIVNAPEKAAKRNIYMKKFSRINKQNMN